MGRNGHTPKFIGTPRKGPFVPLQASMTVSGGRMLQNPKRPRRRRPKKKKSKKKMQQELLLPLERLPHCISDLGSSARDQKAFFVQESFRTLLRGCVQVLK